ncbi:MAG TPA: hypothetical protein VKS98_02055, partial [Chthoniobacterales bacterium]|nr:hypothetical protein [Chthoniobacterales bacterium]
ITIIVCGLVAMALGVSSAYAQSEPTKTVPKTHTCLKCYNKAPHDCPGCHGHFGFDIYGKQRHGHYVHACSGCSDKRCHAPQSHEG